MNTTLRALLSAALVVGLFGVAIAKLPPPTEEQKAAAEAKKAKDAVAAEKAKEEQKRAEDRVVSRYMAEQKAKGVTVTPQLPLNAEPSTASNAGAKPAPASNTAKKK
jgi:hypothetical protein